MGTRVAEALEALDQEVAYCHTNRWPIGLVELRVTELRAALIADGADQ